METFTKPQMRWGARAASQDTSTPGRARIAVRISAVGADLNFDNTPLDKGWVTVEAAEEVPHALTEEARRLAHNQCREAALAEVNITLERLLANVVLDDADTALLEAVARNGSVLIAAGIPEVVVRLLTAAPASTWRNLTPDEKEEIRRCL